MGRIVRYSDSEGLICFDQAVHIAPLRFITPALPSHQQG